MIYKRVITAGWKKEFYDQIIITIMNKHNLFKLIIYKSLKLPMSILNDYSNICRLEKKHVNPSTNDTYNS